MDFFGENDIKTYKHRESIISWSLDGYPCFRN